MFAQVILIKIEICLRQISSLTSSEGRNFTCAERKLNFGVANTSLFSAGEKHHSSHASVGFPETLLLSPKAKIDLNFSFFQKTLYKRPKIWYHI